MQRLTAEAVERAVNPTGRPFRFFDSIGSTNSEAMEWARVGAPDGAAVVAAHQTQGRGRWGRAWSSTPGQLLQLSLVLRPKMPLAQLGLITTALGVACAEAIEDSCGLKPAIKWPNDVRIGGRKAAGILVETQVTGSALDLAIAGIGINVGWTRENIPEELAHSATSLALELTAAGRQPPPLEKLLARLLDRFDIRYRSLPEASAGIVAAASERSDVLGRDVVIALSSNETMEGRALRLGPAGELELETPAGVRAVAAGEVRRLR